LRLRNSEDARSILCEAQEATMLEIQEQIHDYRFAQPLPPPPPFSLLIPLVFFSLPHCLYDVFTSFFLCVHLLNVYFYFLFCVSDVEQSVPWGWAACMVKMTF
jgi:hypothetical protein